MLTSLALVEERRRTEKKGQESMRASRVHDLIGSFQTGCLVTGYSVILLVVFVQVLARYVFHSPIWALDVVAGHSAIWLYFLGAVYGTYERSHIKATLLHVFIKNRRTLALIAAVTTTVAFAVCCFMINWSYEYVIYSITSGEEMEGTRWPLFWFQSALLVGAILMAVYFLVEIVDLFATAKKKREMPE